MSLGADYSYNEIMKMYEDKKFQMNLSDFDNKQLTLASPSQAAVASLKSENRKGIAQRVLDKKSFRLFNKNIKLYIGTMHSSKGLECDDVFVVDSLPKKVKKLIEDETMNSADGKQMESERRLYYVAITRARARVTFVLNMFEKASFLQLA